MEFQTVASRRVWPAASLADVLLQGLTDYIKDLLVVYERLTSLDGVIELAIHLDLQVQACGCSRHRSRMHTIGILHLRHRYHHSQQYLYQSHNQYLNQYQHLSAPQPAPVPESVPEKLPVAEPNPVLEAQADPGTSGPQPVDQPGPGC